MIIKQEVEEESCFTLSQFELYQHHSYLVGYSIGTMEFRSVDR